MADSASAPAPAPAPTPAKKAVKAKKPAASKKPAAHPKYTEMVAAAITSLNERKGSSSSAIKKYIIANYEIVEKSAGTYVRAALKKSVVSGSLTQVKGTGAAGSFKIAEKAAKPKKSTVKKAVKSPKKAAKKPAAKKSPKKSSKQTKAPAAKKPIAKKVKKPSAKKVAAK